MCVDHLTLVVSRCTPKHELPVEGVGGSLLGNAVPVCSRGVCCPLCAAHCVLPLVMGSTGTEEYVKGG